MNIRADKTVVFEPDSIRPKIALVLSGGGARGFSQIGVLQELEKAGIQIDYVVGTSIGAIIGALYSVGYTPNEIDSIMETTDWDEIFSLSSKQDRRELFLDQKNIVDRNIITLNFKNFEFVVPDAVSYGTAFYSSLQNMLWNGIYQSESNFDALKYKYRAVSTDLVSGKSYIHREGNIATAVKASSTFPLMFSPIRKDSLVLVDGGITANIPVEIAMEFNPDIIIAVNTVSPLLERDELTTPINLADQTISISMQYFTKLSLEKADIVISPDIGRHKNVDFTQNDYIVEKGREAASKKIEDLFKLIESKKDKLTTDILSNFNHADINETVLSFKSVGLSVSDSIKIANRVPEFSSEDGLSSLLKDLSYNEYSSIKLQKHDDSKGLVIEADRFNIIEGVNVNSNIDSLNNYFTSNLNTRYLGDQINKSKIVELKEFVLKKMREFGYSFSNIEMKFEGNQIYVDLIEGKIHKIFIHGNENFSEFLITREFTISEGKRANSGEILKTWENLMNTGLFSDIEILPQIKDMNLDIHIYVREKGTQTIRLGARADNERKLQGGLDIIQENFLNIGSRLSFRLAGGERNQEYKIKIEIPRLLSTLYTVDFMAYYKKRYIYQYSTLETNPNNFLDKKIISDDFDERFGITAEAGTQIERTGKLTVQYRFEKQRYFDELELSYDGWYNISSIKVGAIFDSEDDAYFPTKGRVIDLSLETTFFEPDAAIGFSKATFYYGNNISFDDHTISTSFNFGFADKTLPKPEFYSLGGQDMFFGFREDQERGRQKILFSIKYRYLLPIKLFFSTYASIRYDIGSVWEAPENIRFSSLKHGIGGGLTFDTPVGPADFSIGRAIYYKKGLENIIRGPLFGYFSIGISI